jgi:H+/Cl- antiporter ClcA
VADALGLLAFVAYVLAIVGAAAGVTWVVVRLTPSKKPNGPTSS